jgi:hypothetical protein
LVQKVGEFVREFLHIWLGSELPEDYVSNIIDTRRLMRPEDRAILISDRPQGAFEVFPEEKLLEEMRANEVGRLWELSGRRIIEQKNYTVETAKSDFYRFYWCATRPHNVVYSDCDATITEMPFLDEDKPCFAEYNIDRVDMSVIVSHGKTAFFEAFLEDTKDFPREQGLFYKWLNLKIKRETYGKVPFDCFVHDGVWE